MLNNIQQHYANRMLSGPLIPFEDMSRFGGFFFAQ